MGRSHSKKFFPITSLKLLIAPRSNGLAPGSVSSIANMRVVVGLNVGETGCSAGEGGAGEWVVRLGMCTGCGGVRLTGASGCSAPAFCRT